MEGNGSQTDKNDVGACEDAELLVREQEAARRLAVTRRALQAWRRAGTGPAFVRISGRCVRYRVADLRSWAAARIRTNTAEK